MTRRRRPSVAFDTGRFTADIAEAGLLPIDVARRAKASHTTVYRALEGQVSARMMAKLAKALGYSVRRYLVRSTQEAA